MLLNFRSQSQASREENISTQEQHQTSTLEYINVFVWIKYGSKYAKSKYGMHCTTLIPSPTASSENTFTFFRAYFQKAFSNFVLFHHICLPQAKASRQTILYTLNTYMLHISFSKYYYAFWMYIVLKQNILYVYSLFVSHSQFSIFTRTCHTAKPTLTSSKKSVLKAFSLNSVLSCEQTQYTKYRLLASSSSYPITHPVQSHATA